MASATDLDVGRTETGHNRPGWFVGPRIDVWFVFGVGALLSVGLFVSTQHRPSFLAAAVLFAVLSDYPHVIQTSARVWLDPRERSRFGRHHLVSLVVVGAAVTTGVDRLVHTSSIAAIGYPPDDHVADESFLYRDSVARNAYSTTKRHGEALVLGLDRLGLDVVVVNPSAVLAPSGDPRVSWIGLVDTVSRGRLRVVPPGGTAVCAGEDLVDGLIRAMRAGERGRRYIVSSANVTYLELVRLIASVAGAPAPLARIPGRVLGLVGRVCGLVADLPRDPLATPLLVPENVELMTRRLYYDQSRAVRELGISQSPLEPVIGEMVRHCREELAR